MARSWTRARGRVAVQLLNQRQVACCKASPHKNLGRPPACSSAVLPPRQHSFAIARVSRTLRQSPISYAPRRARVVQLDALAASVLASRGDDCRRHFLFLIMNASRSRQRSPNLAAPEISKIRNPAPVCVPHSLSRLRSPNSTGFVSDF